MSGVSGVAANTDRELYREPKGDLPSDYYANSLHVTQQGTIGMNVGGLVITLPIAKWHEAAANLLSQPTADEAEGDEREALADVLLASWAKQGGLHPPLETDRPDALEDAGRVLAAGFRRRDPDAGLRERVEAVIVARRDRYATPNQWVARDLMDIVLREVRAALPADTPTDGAR